MKQLSFISKAKIEFGGRLNKGRRKSARPLSMKRPIHLVLKTQASFELLRNKKQVESLCSKMSAKFGVKIYELAVQPDHVHMVLKIHSRHLYRAWIRALTSRIVSITKLRFIQLPYTRIASWGREFRNLCAYVLLNKDESEREVWAMSRIEEINRRIEEEKERMRRAGGVTIKVA